MAEEPRLIRIGLVVERPEMVLTLNATDRVIDAATGTAVITIEHPVDLVTITHYENQLELNNQPVGGGPLIVVPGDQPLLWNGLNYRGEFIISGQNGKVNLVNRLSVEDYLQGVVPREVSPQWPVATLKAQAIAARTYTYASLERHKSSNFDLCSTTHCQVYGGLSVEKESTNQAVLETAGLVMIYNGKVISALYHSSGGGSTEDAVNVWGFSVPYLKPVVDWDQNSPYYQWVRSVEWTDLQGYTAKTYPQIGRLKQIVPALFGNEERILKIKLIGDLGEITISGEQFRFLTGIPSSNIQLSVIYGPEPYITLWWARSNHNPEVLVANDKIPGETAELINPPWNLSDPWSWLQDKEPVRVVMRGFGRGHRVGLSQWGAKGMAEAGFSERQILEYYYSGINIVDVSSVNINNK